MSLDFKANEENKKIWTVLENFDFSDYDTGDFSNIRVALYISILRAIGDCGSCEAFNKSTGYCSTLKILTNREERCSDFSPNGKELEVESAFSIMAKEFEEAQQNLSSFAKIRKYQRRPNIIRKDDPKPIKEDKK